MQQRAASDIYPLPIFDVPHRPRSDSRRCWQRYSAARHVVSLANQCVSALNRLAVSYSSSQAARNVSSLFDSFCANLSNPIHGDNANLLTRARNPSSNTPNAAQSRLLAHVFRCAQRHVRRRGSDQPVSDDAQSSNFSTDPFSLFDNDLYLPAHMRFSSLDSYISRPTGANVSVIPLVSHRISLPDTGEAVDLLDLLPPDVAARYARPDPSLLLAAHERAQPPRVRMAATRREWTALVQRLAARGMIDFTTEPVVVCGAHAVPKSDTTDRFIIDARPANTHFVESPDTKLPTPDLLARLVTDARAGRRVHVAKVDLDNFYHRLRIPQWLRPYFALKPVRAGDVGLAERYGGANVLIYPCCATLPMGWSHSVYLAQAAHEHLLNTRTLLQPCDRITADNDARVDRTRLRDPRLVASREPHSSRQPPLGPSGRAARLPRPWHGGSGGASFGHVPARP